MKTKNILLLIVAIFISFSTASAQYIENDTRVLDEGVKTTRAMPMITSAEPEPLDAQITTTSLEETESDIIAPTSSEVPEAINTTDAEPTLYDAEPTLYDDQATTTEATPELADDKGMTFNRLFGILGSIIIILVIAFVLSKKKKD